VWKQDVQQEIERKAFGHLIREEAEVDERFLGQRLLDSYFGLNNIESKAM